MEGVLLLSHDIAGRPFIEMAAVLSRSTPTITITPPPATIKSTTTPTGKRKQTRGATTLKSIHDFKF